MPFRLVSRMRCRWSAAPPPRSAGPATRLAPTCVNRNWYQAATPPWWEQVRWWRWE